MSNEQAMAVIDAAREQLRELGIEDVLIAIGGDQGVAFSFAGATKSLAYLSMSAWLEIMMSSVANSYVDTGTMGED
tara:strand:+ start:932 stop:1159 length:228 start_codon:yes stop_codon:yes gene_type:complete